MAISEDELKKLMSIPSYVDRISTVSSDGKNLLSRIPKEVREFLMIKKGDKIRWLVDSNRNVRIEINK